jgi:hypothetical protein
MPDTGWVTCGRGSDFITIGSVAWVNPNRITGSGGYATCTLGTISHWLVADTFGFTNAHFGGLVGCTILGIEAEITRHMPGGTVDVFDNSVKFMKVGDDRGDGSVGRRRVGKPYRRG